MRQAASFRSGESAISVLLWGFQVQEIQSLLVQLCRLEALLIKSFTADVCLIVLTSDIFYIFWMLTSMTYDILCQLNVMFWWRFSGMRTTQLTWTTTIWKGDILLGPCYLRLSWRSTALWGKTQSMRLEAELGIYLRSNSFLSHNALASGTYLFWPTSKTTSPNFTRNAKYKNICLSLQNKFGLESWYLPWIPEFSHLSTCWLWDHLLDRFW